MAIAEKRLRQPTKAGIVTSAAQVRDMLRISPDVTYPFLEWVASPEGGFDLRNENRSVGSGDGHTTGSFGANIPTGSEGAVALSWNYKLGEFEQTARNLIWQTQFPGHGSPAFAISTEQKTDEWSAVTRDGSDLDRDILGKILWGHRTFFVVQFKIAEKPNGFFKIWMAYDKWPDFTKSPTVQRLQMDSSQGDKAQMTYGMYALHSKPGKYQGFGRHFAIAATPQRAIELAMMG